MKVLFFDCGMGAAGDMLMGALASLLSAEEQEAFIQKMNSLGIPDVQIVLEDDEKCGVKGKHIRVFVHGEEEESHDEHHHEHCHDHDHHHDHDHEHDHDHDHDHHHDHEHDHDHDHEHDHHHHDHHHASMAHIEHLISHLDVSDRVKQDVSAIYRIIAQAECKVHGKEMDEIHFHEVGTKDALADITGCALLMEKLSPERIVASPVNTGFGKVRCMHGILPVPAPATALILEGIPVYAGRFEGEMCTPTGAAILKHFVNEFSQMPLMQIRAVGYGMGTKEFPAANAVRAILGETQGDTDTVFQLSCNLDDMTAEDLSYAMSILLENGAKDVYTVPIGMKQSRPAVMLCVLCADSNMQKMAELMFFHTTTLGIRTQKMERMVLDRSFRTEETEYGPVRIKRASGYGVEREKPEYADLKAAADKSGKPIREIRELIEKKKAGR